MDRDRSALRGIIVAVSPENVIGVEGRIPWRHPGDMKRFKRLTMGGTLIMGRKTFESMGRKPLPGRRNIVITKAALPDVEVFRSIPEALKTCHGPVWFIGGAGIYREALAYADFIDVTYVPDRIDAPNAVRFPDIDADVWVAEPRIAHEDAPGVERTVFWRRTDA